MKHIGPWRLSEQIPSSQHRELKKLRLLDLFVLLNHGVGKVRMQR